MHLLNKYVLLYLILQVTLKMIFKLQLTCNYSTFRCLTEGLAYVYIIYKVITCINLFNNIHLIPYTVIIIFLTIFPMCILHHHDDIVTTKLCF